MARKSGLGKGLEALFEDNSTQTLGAQTMRLSLLEPNKDQPRRDFDEEAIANLADSIRQHGLLQPLLVRPLMDGRYQIVAGERRWRACRMIGLDEVPVLVRELSDSETMQLALIENLQRENLNPIEEALGYRELIDRYSMTQDAVAKIVGRSRSAVANALRLLALPEKAMTLVREGTLSVGHAKALLGLESADALDELAVRAAREGMTVREVERLASRTDAPQKERSPAGENRDSYYAEMELALNEELGTRVRVRRKGDGGTLELDFASKDDLRSLAEKLTRE